MKHKSIKFSGFNLVFFGIAVGTLISAGIYLAKFLLMEGSTANFFSALIFSMIGIGITGWSFFASAEKKSI